MILLNVTSRLEYVMRRMSVLSAVTASLLLASVAVAAGQDATSGDTATLSALGCEMGRAYARRDLATLDRLNAEDYTQTDTRGVVVTHDEYPEYVRQRTADTFKNGVSTLSIDCENIEVRMYGDAAVVTGGWTYTVHKGSGDTNRRSRWTSMWTRYPTGWKRHVFQNTWVNSDANRPVPCANGSVVPDASTPNKEDQK
jgi:ketosteroid isomerase-like protein